MVVLVEGMNSKYKNDMKESGGVESAKYYVYKITDEEDMVLYVGQTKNIDGRVKNHLSNKHWILEGYKFYVFEMDSKTDSDIYEIYYINKFNPFYNVANSNNKSFSIDLPDIKFELYKTISDEDLLLRNKRFAENNNKDKSYINLSSQYASKLSSDLEEFIVGCIFGFMIYEKEPVTTLKVKLKDDVDIIFYIAGGLHKFFNTKENKNHIHNIKIYSFMISSLMDKGGEISDDYTIANLDTLDLSNYELLTKEEAKTLQQNIKDRKESVLY